MKKGLILLVLCFLVFGSFTACLADQATVSQRIAAWEGESPLTCSTDIHAIVEPYAAITWDNIPFLEFEGSNYEYHSTLTSVKVRCNSPIRIDFSGTKLTQCADDGSSIPDPDSIDTYYYHYLGILPIPVHATSTIAATWGGYSTSEKGSSRYFIGISGQLGSITDQAAGSYKSTIQMTVSSSVARPLWD